MVDRGGAAQFPFQFLVKAEDCSFAAAVDIPCAAAAGLEGTWDIGIQACQRGGAGSCLRIGSLGVLQADNVASASASCM